MTYGRRWIETGLVAALLAGGAGIAAAQERPERDRADRAERMERAEGQRPARPARAEGERPASFEERWAQTLERQGADLDEPAARRMAVQSLERQWTRLAERLDGAVELTAATPSAAACGPHLAALRAERAKVDGALGGGELGAARAALAAMSASLGACGEIVPKAKRERVSAEERAARRDGGETMERQRGERGARVAETDPGRALRQSARRLAGLAERARVMEAGIEAKFGE